MLSGAEWLVDATGCDPNRLRDGEKLRAICDRLVTERELHVIGQSLWHQFPWPGGWTGLYLLSESHLTCHTFPEGGLATFSLYCCRPRQDWPWHERLNEMLAASDVTVRRVARGLPVPPRFAERTEP